MYRWLLCFCYLRTRYIALASIISVTLGVATLIVVNSVMAGFSSEMHERLHGLSSDFVIDCHTSGGMPNPEGTIDQILKLCGDDVVINGRPCGLDFTRLPWNPNAVKISVGLINAVSGETANPVLHADPQDYLVCPEQPWLDGIHTGQGAVR